MMELAWGCRVGVALINGLGSAVDRLYTLSGAASPAFNPSRESRRQAAQQFGPEAFKSGIGLIGLGAGTMAGTRGAAGDFTTIYRAVGPNELADIRAIGRYRVGPSGMDGKYFFKTSEQASNFAKMAGDKAYTTTSVQVSPAELARGQMIQPLGEGPGYFFATPDLPSGPVKILNSSARP